MTPNEASILWWIGGILFSAIIARMAYWWGWDDAKDCVCDKCDDLLESME